MKVSSDFVRGDVSSVLMSVKALLSVETYRLFKGKTTFFFQTGLEEERAAEDIEDPNAYK